MDRRAVIGVGATCWALVGAAVALASLAEVDADARLLVGAASVLFPACAAAAAVLVRRGSDRPAGLLLLASAATPTYFAYVLNVPAAVIGMVLVVAPAAVVGDDPRRSDRPGQGQGQGQGRIAATSDRRRRGS